MDNPGPRVFTWGACVVLLAIDRVVGVAFPYRYRNIMKLRVAYALIASVWIIAAVLLFSYLLDYWHFHILI